MSTSLDAMAYEAAAKSEAWSKLPILMADMDSGEIVYCTEFAASMFGYTADELNGQQLEILIPHDLRTSHAMWRQDANVPRTRLMGVGRRVHGLRKSGEVFPVHVGLTAMEAMGKKVGIAFVIDLTGIMMPAIIEGVSLVDDEIVKPSP